MDSLPIAVRNLTKFGIDDFKAKLDKYLESIPDEPKMENYTPNTCSQTTGKASNFMIDHAILWGRSDSPILIVFIVSGYKVYFN